jgi:hypothetical protein
MMNVSMDHLRDGEEIQVVLRRHWIVYIILVFYFILALAFSGILWGFFGLEAWVNLLLCIFWMVFFLFIYVEWLNHELDTFVVTSLRVIGIEQLSFLNRVVSECNLRQVQEVNSSTKGFFANVFNYGTITVQTAGSSTNFVMHFCPDPLDNARKMLNTVEKFRRKDKEREEIEKVEMIKKMEAEQSDY